MKKAFFTLGLALALMLTGFAVYPGHHLVSAGEMAKGTSVIAVPENVDYVTDIKTMPTGELVLLGANRFDKTLTQYVSMDEGVSWQKECEYLEKLSLDMSSVEAVEASGKISDDGYVALCVDTYKKHFYNMTAETEAEAGAELFAYIIDPEGEVVEVEQPETEEYGGYFNAYFAGEKLYFDDVRCNLYEVERATGKLLGQVMERGTFYSASVASDSDALQVVSDTSMGHPFGTPFPGEEIDGDEILSYSSAAEAVNGDPNTAYVVDLDGIHIFSKDSGKQTIWENHRDDFNKYSQFYDMTALDDDTFFVVMFNEKVGGEQLIKIDIKE